MPKWKKGRQRPAKTPEQYVEARLREFAHALFIRTIKERGIDLYEAHNFDVFGNRAPSNALKLVRKFVEEGTIKELRSFRGDTEEIAKGRDITISWAPYGVNFVHFRERSVVDRLADLAEGEEPASG